jgi:glyoxylase-like metal-dependent hydrolase (beta-lactamase superfamily II)
MPFHAALLLACAAHVAALHAQGTAPADRTAADDARAYIQQALEALGGERRVRAIATVEVQGTGAEFRAAEGQGWSPGKATRAEHRETLVADFPRERVSHEYRTARHDGSTRWRRFIYAGGDRAWAEFTSRTASWAPHPRAADDRRELFRRLPHYILLEAWDNPAGLTLLPDSTEGDRRWHVVSYLIPGRKETVRLLLDAESSLLGAVTQRVDFLGRGDATAEIAYDGYTRHAALGWFPAGHELRLDGMVHQQVRYTRVAANDPTSLTAFEIPEEMRGFTAAPDSARSIAPGVYVYTSPQGFNALFVEFNDHVMAVEAPGRGGLLGEIPYDTQSGASAVSEAMIERIHQTVPGKPIRYLAVTHHHSDHAGGTRAFFAEGATLLTTPGTRAYFDALGRASTTVVPDRLARTGGAPRIETVARKRVLTDGTRTVELINAGANPHTEEALVVWLPAERILFQGDLFYYDGEPGFPERDRLITMAHFGRWLERTGLKPERIYGTHDRGVATMDHVRRALREAGATGLTAR